MDPAPTDPYRALAEGHALGTLDGEDRAAFEAHLGSGCPGCREAVAAFTATLSSLAGSAPAPPLYAALRQQVVDLAGLPKPPIDPVAYAWDEIAPGIRAHVLREDPSRQMRACLVWAKPGVRNERHRHGGDEIILVLQGGLRDDRGTYGPGDVCRSRTGSVHTEEVLPGDECFCYVVYYGELEYLP